MESVSFFKGSSALHLKIDCLDLQVYLKDMQEAMGALSCAAPIAIEVVTVYGEKPASETGETFKIFKKDKGFVCLNQDQV